MYTGLLWDCVLLVTLFVAMITFNGTFSFFLSGVDIVIEKPFCIWRHRMNCLNAGDESLISLEKLETSGESETLSEFVF